MGLTSSIYSAAPSPAVTGDERARRNRRALRRVIAVYGLSAVRERLRAAAPSDTLDGLIGDVEVEAVRAWARGRD